MFNLFTIKERLPWPKLLQFEIIIIIDHTSFSRNYIDPPSMGVLAEKTTGANPQGLIRRLRNKGCPM
jgi:hypothetical protein